MSVKLAETCNTLLLWADFFGFFQEKRSINFVGYNVLTALRHSDVLMCIFHKLTLSGKRTIWEQAVLLHIQLWFFKHAGFIIYYISTTGFFKQTYSHTWWWTEWPDFLFLLRHLQMKEHAASGLRFPSTSCHGIKPAFRCALFREQTTEGAAV